MRFHKVQQVDVEAMRRGRRIMYTVVIVTMIPAFLMTINIVRRNVVGQSVQRFVHAELDRKGTQILSSRHEHDTLYVVAIGKEITEHEIDEARSRMHFYGLGDMDLAVIQAGSDDNGAIAATLSNAEQTNHALSSQIGELQRQLAAYSAYDTLSVHVSAEARTLFPEVKRVDVGRMNGRTVALVERAEGRTLGSDSRTRLETWLRTRVGDKKIEVVVKGN